MANYRDWPDNRGSNFMAGFIGAIIGAAGAAAAIFLSDRENRRKAKEKFDELRDRGDRTMQDLRRQASRTRKEVEEEVEDRTGKKDREEKTR